MVQPWTINDAETMQRMIDLNVNGIITDYPSMLLEMLGRS
jgi:glycerophosphoryl diester phosphodiesterase